MRPKNGVKRPNRSRRLGSWRPPEKIVEIGTSVTGVRRRKRAKNLTFTFTYTYTYWNFLQRRFVLALLQFLLLLFSPTRVDGFLHSYRSVATATATAAATLQNNRNSPRKILLAGTPPSEGDGQQSTKKNVRLQVFQTLNNPVVEVFLFALVLLSSLLVALDTLQDLPSLLYTTMDDALLLINLIFALDFFVRWYAAGQFKPIYLTKPLVVLDIVVVLVPLLLGSAMLPLLNYWGVVTHDYSTISSTTNQQAAVASFLYGIQSSAGLKNLLLLRVLRLRRVLTDFTTFGKFAVVLGLRPQDIRPYQLQLARVFLSIFTLLSVASGLIYTAEHQVNAAIPDYFAALYFTLTTLTTVGLGDIAPITPQGRLVVCGAILLGVTIIPVQTAKLVDIFVESQKDQQRRKRVVTSRRKTASSYSPAPSFASVQSATNGLGPSGIAIEVPVQEDRLRDLTSAETRMPEPRICESCTASPHRSDAAFCWSCGTPLPMAVLLALENRMMDEGDDDEIGLS